MKKPPKLKIACVRNLEEAPGNVDIVVLPLSNKVSSRSEASELSSKLDTYVVVASDEYCEKDGRRYVVSYLTRKGEILLEQRKVHSLPEGYGRGSFYSLAKVGDVKIALLPGEDIRHYEPAAIVSMKGAVLLLSQWSKRPGFETDYVIHALTVLTGTAAVVCSEDSMCVYTYDTIMELKCPATVELDLSKVLEYRRSIAKLFMEREVATYIELLQRIFIE